MSEKTDGRLTELLVYRLLDRILHTPPTQENQRRISAMHENLRRLLGDRAYEEFCKLYRL